MAEKILSIEQELELAKNYASDGEFNREYFDRCLSNARKLAREQGKDISNEEKEIEDLWKKSEEVADIIDMLEDLSAKSNIDLTEEIQGLHEKFFGWKFNNSK